jgi:ADP-heptose:LPS heptosyltransferase
MEIIPSIPPGVQLQRILLMRQDRIGDMIMTLPLIRRLSEVWPGVRTTVVASESNSVILKHEPDIQVIEHSRNPADYIASLIRVREFGPDASVDLHMHDSTTSLIYSLASGARWRLHVDRDNRLPFNVRVSASQDGHIMEAFTDLLSGLGRPVSTRDMDRMVRLSQEERDFAAYFWSVQDCPPGDCGVVNVSAGGENREWAWDKYSAVCADMVRTGLRPLVVSDPKDRDKAAAISRSVPKSVLAPQTETILHLAAILEGTLLLVSPDTSVIHLASSLNIPVVGLYLPFDPSLPKWYPWMVESQVIMAEDSNSLESIDPAAVCDSVRIMLAGLR